MNAVIKLEQSTAFGAAVLLVEDMKMTIAEFRRCRAGTRQRRAVRALLFGQNHTLRFFMRAAVLLITLHSSLLTLNCPAQAPGAPGSPEAERAAAAKGTVKSEELRVKSVPTIVEREVAALPEAMRGSYATARAAVASDGGLALRTWFAGARLHPRTRAILQLDLSDAMVESVEVWKVASDKDNSLRQISAAERLRMTTAIRDAEIVLQLLRPRVGAWADVMGEVGKRMARMGELRAALATAK